MNKMIKYKVDIVMQGNNWLRGFIMTSMKTINTLQDSIKAKEIVKVMDNEDYTSNVNESVLGDVIQKIKEKHGKSI
jgi:hypothetical protein